MKEWLWTIFCIGTFIIGLMLAIDLGVQAKHRLNGTPTDKRMWEHMIAKSNETIQAQEKAIKTQAETIRQLKRQLSHLLERYNNEVGEKKENE